MRRIVLIALFIALVGVLLLAPGWAVGRSSREPVKQADRIIIVKSERSMTLLRQGKVLKTYKVALGREPRGPKVQVGDNRTPEGESSETGKLDLSCRLRR